MPDLNPIVALGGNPTQLADFVERLVQRGYGPDTKSQFGILRPEHLCVVAYVSLRAFCCYMRPAEQLTATIHFTHGEVDAAVEQLANAELYIDAPWQEFVTLN